VKETLKQREARRRRSLELRVKALTFLCNGQKPHCQCPGCPVDFIGFLQCDHVNGDGAAHRRLHKLGTGADALWKFVLDNPNQRDQFQVLCCNCNHSKFNGPACEPHGKPHHGDPQQIPIVEFDPALPALEAEPLIK
jgi:hypothetical protein